MTVGDLTWLVEVVVPERDYTQQIDAEARVALGLGILALVVAAAGGVAVARWIASPLRELADVARRIRHGQLDVTIAPRSRDQIGVLARAMGGMGPAVAHPDFVPETLGRYVSPELAERALRDPGALRPGGEGREVAM